MTSNKQWAASLAVLGLSIVAPFAISTTQAATPLPDGVYLNLTQDFYNALRQETQVKTYGTHTDEAHLKELAISARFLVQTNLAILKQQEEMVRLMRDVLKQR